MFPHPDDERTLRIQRLNQYCQKLQVRYEAEQYQGEKRADDRLETHQNG